MLNREFSLKAPYQSYLQSRTHVKKRKTLNNNPLNLSTSATHNNQRLLILKEHKKPTIKTKMSLILNFCITNSKTKQKSNKTSQKIRFKITKLMRPNNHLKSSFQSNHRDRLNQFQHFLQHRQPISKHSPLIMYRKALDNSTRTHRFRAIKSKRSTTSKSQVFRCKLRSEIKTNPNKIFPWQMLSRKNLDLLNLQPNKKTDKLKNHLNQQKRCHN